jgi:hypothetical protein
MKAQWESADMKRSVVILTLSVAALVWSTAALARGDEKVRWNPQPVQSAQTSSQEALARLRAQEAALLKKLAELHQSMAKALEKSGK